MTPAALDLAIETQRLEIELALSEARRHAALIISTNYPNTPGLGSNGEYRQERDGLSASQECHILHKKDRLPVAFGPSVKTGYEPDEDSRQVPSPTQFIAGPSLPEESAKEAKTRRASESVNPNCKSLEHYL